jgi:hypothetical protein
MESNRWRSFNEEYGHRWAHERKLHIPLNCRFILKHGKCVNRAGFPHGPHVLEQKWATARSNGVQLLLKLRCNKRSAYTERPTPPLIEEEAQLLNTYMSRREQNSWPWISTRPEARNDYAGEGRQQFNRSTYRPLAKHSDFWQSDEFYFPQASDQFWCHHSLVKQPAQA